MSALSNGSNANGVKEITTGDGAKVLVRTTETRRRFRMAASNVGNGSADNYESAENYESA